MPYLGEGAALGAAMLWAVASMIFQRLGTAIEPLRLNAIKGIASLLMFGATIAIGGAVLPSLDRASLLTIGASGLVGIGFGDTAFFKTLNCLGPRRTLLLMTSAAPMTVLLAMVTLGETLTTQAIVGIAAIVAGIAWVISDREADVRGEGSLWLGVLWGLLASGSHAGGMVLARAALADTGISPLWSTVLRLSIGIFPLLLWEGWGALSSGRSRRAWRNILTNPKLMLGIVLSSLFGTYLAIWLQQTSIKFAPVAIAQTLTSTSPLFVLPLAAWAGDRISWRSLGGVAIVLCGVALLFSR